MPELVASDLTADEFKSYITPKKGKDLKLTFSNVSAHVKLANGQQKAILDGVTGSALTGQVMAVMGATGCGKVSLSITHTN
jgi:ABC-type transport system involved in cytochrome bd biosynthesis fused ATPase/permease subunit